MGAIPKKAPIARIIARIPAEYMLTSISKPGRILPSQMLSIFIMSHAASGPTIMAPRNMGTWLPTTTPMQAMEATTPPRSP